MDNLTDDVESHKEEYKLSIFDECKKISNEPVIFQQIFKLCEKYCNEQIKNHRDMHFDFVKNTSDRIKKLEVENKSISQDYLIIFKENNILKTKIKMFKILFEKE